MNAWRRVFAPAGAVAGPVVAALVAACARAFNGSRLRPLTPAERARLPGHDAACLDGVRIAEHSHLPLLPGFVAITLGHDVYVRGALQALPGELLAHELVHVRQYRQMGWRRMTAAYGRLWVLHGYEAHPMEVEARRN